MSDRKRTRDGAIHEVTLTMYLAAFSAVAMVIAGVVYGTGWAGGNRSLGVVALLLGAASTYGVLAAVRIRRRLYLQDVQADVEEPGRPTTLSRVTISLVTALILGSAGYATADAGVGVIGAIAGLMAGLLATVPIEKRKRCGR